MDRVEHVVVGAAKKKNNARSALTKPHSPKLNLQNVDRVDLVVVDNADCVTDVWVVHQPLVYLLALYKRERECE